MNEFLQQVWWNNPVKDYFIVFGVILLVLILNRLISRYFAALLYKPIGRAWKEVDKSSFINLIIQPLGSFLIILVSVVALHELNFPNEINTSIYGYSTRQILHALGDTILIISFTRLLVRAIDFIAIILEIRANQTPDQTDNQLIVFFKDFFKVIIGIIGIMLVLRFAFNLHIGSLLTGLSIVGAAIALALRESIENLIASFIIFFDKPFTIGDLVKVLAVSGTVERIGLRSTRIRTDQKTLVTVPNKQMVDTVVDNLSLRTQRRAELRLEIDLKTPLEKVEALVNGIRSILKRKEIEEFNCYLNDISRLAFVIQTEYNVSPVTLAEFNGIKQDVNLNILKLMEALKVEIAGLSVSDVSKSV